MGFCPVPHASRDQVWLVVGALVGVGLARFTGLDRLKLGCPFSTCKDGDVKEPTGVTTPRVLKSKRVTGNKNKDSLQTQHSDGGEHSDDSYVMDGPINIDEIVGNSSILPSTENDHYSVAVVSIDASVGELNKPKQKPEFEELNIILEGTMSVEFVNTANGNSSLVIAKAGESLWLPKGYTYDYKFPQNTCKYIAICCPAFSINNAGVMAPEVEVEFKH